jgi:hypothetical protein
MLATHYLDDSKQDNITACYPKLNKIGAYWAYLGWTRFALKKISLISEIKRIVIDKKLQKAVRQKSVKCAQKFWLLVLLGKVL